MKRGYIVSLILMALATFRDYQSTQCRASEILLSVVIMAAIVCLAFGDTKSKSAAKLEAWLDDVNKFGRG